ncbi:response regulator [Paenibacillus soyae]|uniref:Response regulator n=1 Tax=Paenibacillus soyae TaxID=2969249 RepID=A0A9X2S7A8_9BACL|nr:response regulator [Paenibacillus soyae]MCR2802850.1 response regulator [Paenibacillus soyae]
MNVFITIGAAAAGAAVIIGIIQHVALRRQQQKSSSIGRSEMIRTELRDARNSTGASPSQEKDIPASGQAGMTHGKRRGRPGGSRQPVILLVDDGITLRQLMAEMLRDRGYVVMEAGTGLEAVQAAAEKRPDCVLLDVRLPDMSGIEALKEIRRKGCDASVVLMTGYMDERQMEEANRIGFDRLLTKPFDLIQVRLAVEQLLNAEELNSDIG